MLDIMLSILSSHTLLGKGYETQKFLGEITCSY